jgi:hypothetical protein
MKKIILYSIAILSLGLASCTKDHSSSSSATTSHVSVMMTDAPGAYDAVILSVKQVVVVTSTGQQTLNVSGGPINLLHFMLGKDTLLAAQDIPAGSIEQVRLVLNSSGNQVVVAVRRTISRHQAGRNQALS